MSELTDWTIGIGDRFVRLAYMSKELKQPQSEQVIFDGKVYKMTVEKL